MRSVRQADRSIQMLMHRHRAARQTGSPAHRFDLQAEVLKADRVVPVHCALELQREDEIQIPAAPGYKRAARLRRPHLNVAHSLGALISGDMLNLLQHQLTHQDESNDPGLRKFGFGRPRGHAEIPIRLFTMGNPIRQLHNRFFPYLYDWVRDSPDNGSKPLPTPPEQPPDEIAFPWPVPADLGVEKWVSAYRSGDYVGRSLWLDGWYGRTDKCDKDGIYPEEMKKIKDKDGTRIEFCIGAGAHTHYWDDTAPDIAETLNELINEQI
jgi:hypothetical protein